MRVQLYKPDSGQQYDITGACASVTWKGSASSACRTLDFAYVNDPYDSAIKIPSISVGDLVSLEDEKEGEVFYGQIFGIEKSSDIGTITFTASDPMKHLLESKGQYNFQNVTPEAITMQVAADVQFPLRYADGIPSIYVTGVNIASLICDQMSLYDIIMAAYTKAHKITGDKYFAMIYKRGLGVYKAEWIVNGFTLSDSSNITASNFSESMDAIVNRVKVYDDKGNQIGEVNDADSAGKFGIFQEVYKQEEGVDPTTAATKLLKSKPQQKIKINALGDINCLSCYYVMLHDAATGLSGRYWISSDSHTWQNGVHTMELELEFEAIMNTKEVKEEDKDKKSKSTKKEASTK